MHRRDAILLEEVGHAVGQGLHDLVLALHHFLEIEPQVADQNPMPGKTRACQRVQLAGIEQRLAGDAADVEAGPAQGLALVDRDDFHAELGRTNRRHVATRSGSDHR